MGSYKENLSTDELEAKLKYIHLKWGINESELETLTSDPKYIQGLDLSKNMRKKFSKYLGCIDEVIKRMIDNGLIDKIKNENSPNFQKIKDDANEKKRRKFRFMKPYDNYIRKHLSEEDYKAYKSGEWNDDITGVVSSAQNIFMNCRAKTKKEHASRATLQPRPDYHRKYNK